MEGTPPAIDTVEMLAEINAVENVIAVHDFHCWSLSKGKYAMSAHIVCTTDAMGILNKSTKIVKEYGIDMVTIQMED